MKNLPSHPFENPNAVAVFALYPENVWAQFLRLRQLVLDNGAETKGVGALAGNAEMGRA